MLCFKKQPFETRLSAINNQYFLPEEHIYSEELIHLIQLCFTVNPAHRPPARKIKEKIKSLMKRKKAHIDINYEKELDMTKDELDHVTEKLFKKTEIAQASFFDKIKRIYNQMTTQTEGWIVSFIEDSE